jgi:carboxypeptidase Taq
MAKSTPVAYKQLSELSQKIHTLASVLTLLHWDQETYMPPGGITPRSHQIAQMSELIHEEKTSHKFKGSLEKLVSLSSGKPKVKGLSKVELVNIREWRKDFVRATKLPASFVKEFSELTSQSSQVWAEAKKSNNFKLFAPFLEKIVSMNRKKADILGFGDHPYDALIETYEPCMTSVRIDSIFGPLQKELKLLIKKIDASKATESAFLRKPCEKEKQMELGQMLLSKLPIDSDYTRLDLSSHPFSIALHPHDSRITTRIIEGNFMSNLFSILHEMGHSFYEMGLPTMHWGTPLSEAVSLSIHESQSRWWETLIGRSLPFWKGFYPELQTKMPHFKKISLGSFYKAINQVKPTLIRVEADEVTYCLHVILRFEIEKLLIGGKLAVSELPDVWREKMKEYLGIAPKTDREGCLQDIHWSLGDFGYFPTYALGNLFSAHFFAAFAKKHSDWEKRVEGGDLAFVREWLKVNIHRWGRTYNADELAKKVTGKPLTADAYCAYLKKKYASIYNF